MAEAGLETAVKGPENEHPLKAFGWAARDSSGELSPFDFSRRAVGDDDVYVKILYCGLCHSDIHLLKNEWGISQYPMVPGHEIVGEVTDIGKNVTKLKVGDRAAVGCLVGSCGTCNNCTNMSESYCSRFIITFSSTYHDGTRTYGGFSDGIVVDQRFVFRFPDSLPLDAGAPLLCAGITVYSPLVSHGLAQPGNHIGVVGLGGLGHMAVKFAKALGLKVTAISTSPSKEKEAIERFGADAFILSHDPEQIKAAAGTMDGIIDTVSAKHQLYPLMQLLKSHGKLIVTGAPQEPFEIPALPLLFGGLVVIGTSCGGTTQTQEMLNFAAEHNITADIELIPMDYIMTALERLAKGDVKYRFVVDIANTLKPTCTSHLI